MLKKLIIIFSCIIGLSSVLTYSSFAKEPVEGGQRGSNSAKSLTTAATSAVTKAKQTNGRDCKDLDGNRYTACMSRDGNYDSSKMNGRDCKNLDGNRYTTCMSRVGNYDSSKTTTVPATNGTTGTGGSQTSTGSSSDSSQTTGGSTSGITSNVDGSDENNGSSSGSGSIVNNYADVAPTHKAFEGRTGEYFLGLVSWDNGVNIDDQESLKIGIWLIAVNVLTDLTVIASYLVLGYVIYGGYLYTFSTGDAGKVEKAKKTLSQAFIGLAIVLLANVIMNAIRFALLGANGALADCATSNNCVNPTALVSGAISWVTAVAGIASAIFVVYGGIMYMTSTGDAGKVEKAKKMITYALIGLAIVALSVVITSFVTSTINGSNPAAFINQNYAISKEAHDKETY